MHIKREETKMRKLLLAGAAAAALIVAAPAAMAHDISQEEWVGGTAGAWTGGTIGFFLGGPIGAVIGAWTGGAIGASVLSEDVSFQSGGDIDVDFELDVGVVVDEDIELRAIEGEDEFGYFRANGRIYVVELDTRTIVEIREG
jgi:hypothetical protein